MAGAEVINVENREDTVRGLISYNAQQFSSGIVYDVHEGGIGGLKNAIVKVAYKNCPLTKCRKTSGELVANEVEMSYQLMGCSKIARLIHHESNKYKCYIVQERYYMDLENFIHASNSGVTEFDDFNQTKMFKAMFRTLDYMHKRHIAHCDLRLKNLYIHRAGNFDFMFNRESSPNYFILKILTGRCALAD